LTALLSFGSEEVSAQLSTLSTWKIDLKRVVAHKDWGADYVALLKLYRSYVR